MKTRSKSKTTTESLSSAPSDIDPRVALVMEISKNQPPQKSAAWIADRGKYITASEAVSALKLTYREIELRNNDIIELPVEKKIGQVAPAYNNYATVLKSKCGAPKPDFAPIAMTAMNWGNAYESIITDLYRSFTGKEVMEFNLIPHPTIEFLAASPDGITADGRMLEIKCPYTRIPTGKPSLQYWVQMQMQMECCNLDVCDFVEVVMKEYGNRDTYIEDSYGSPGDSDYVYSRSSNGLPKGMLIQRDITGGEGDIIASKYYYPPVLHFKSPQEESDWLDNWSKELMAELSKSENPSECSDFFFKSSFIIRYWYVDQWHCNAVHRDRAWFADRLPEFAAFWNLVLKYRAEGIPDKIERHDSSPVPDLRSYKSSSSASSSASASLSRSSSNKVVNSSNDACMFGDDDE